MSELSASNAKSAPLRLAGEGEEAPAVAPPLPKPAVGGGESGVQPGIPAAGAVGPRPAAMFFGLCVLMAGVLLAAVPQGTWSGLFADVKTPAPSATPSEPTGAIQEWISYDLLASESARWIISSLMVLAGLSVLRARAIAVVVTASLFALSAYTCDLLLDGRLTRIVSSVFGDGTARFALPVLSAAFGFLAHGRPDQAKTSVRGVIGLVLVAAAALGTVHGWYDWTPLASRIGPDAQKVLSERRSEFIWATVIILTAIGVASSRTKPIHLMIALMLGAMAWHCVSSGMIEIRSFPELARLGQVPSVEDSSYRNVAIWRWVVAGEMVLLGVILLHLSLGMGSLNIAFALAWMFVGLGLYSSIGSMSLARFFGEYAASQAASRDATTTTPPPADPLANWGLPLGGQPPRPQGAAGPGTKPAAATGPGTSATSRRVDEADIQAARQRAMASVQRAPVVREVTPLIWMFVTAILAGIIGVTGVAMMTQREGPRTFILCALWLATGVCIALLWSVWPKGSETWQGAVAAFKYSRYHTGAIWLAFIGTAAVAGAWALRKNSSIGAWIHASVAAILLGTCCTLGAAAIMIRFGGFPSLPAWIYVAIAIGQSSLMWSLLTYQNMASRRSARLA